jgi:hypothetical protein
MRAGKPSLPQGALIGRHHEVSSNVRRTKRVDSGAHVRRASFAERHVVHSGWIVSHAGRKRNRDCWRRVALRKEAVMEAPPSPGREEEQKPSKKEGCLNGVADLACCFTTAALLLGVGAGSALVVREAKRGALRRFS